MGLNDILQGMHLISKGYNQAQKVASQADYTSITRQDINDYFNITHYIIRKVSDSPYIAMLTIYKNIINSEHLQPTDNPTLNSFFNSLAQLVELEVAKSQYAEELLSFVYSTIDRDFKDITIVCENDVELSRLPDVKHFVLNTTPVIQAKIKKAVSESMEQSKKNAHLQEIEKNNNG